MSGAQTFAPNDRGIGGHHRPHEGKNDEWLTPPDITDKLGPFDLDPCSPIVRPWPTATRHLTIEDDGYTSEWGDDEFVWCNPPYGPHTWKWLDRLFNHDPGGIALIFARTETAGFTEFVWKQASALLFLEGRLHFHYVDGSRAKANSGAPSVLIAYGKEAADRLRHAQQSGTISGTYIDTWCN